MRSLPEAPSVRTSNALVRYRIGAVERTRNLPELHVQTVSLGTAQGVIEVLEQRIQRARSWTDLVLSSAIIIDYKKSPSRESVFGGERNIVERYPAFETKLLEL